MCHESTVFSGGLSLRERPGGARAIPSVRRLITSSEAMAQVAERGRGSLCELCAGIRAAPGCLLRYQLSSIKYPRNRARPAACVPVRRVRTYRGVFLALTAFTLSPGFEASRLVEAASRP
eukprot:6273205-Prymnesium_polylepis.1